MYLCDTRDLRPIDKLLLPYVCAGAHITIFYRCINTGRTVLFFFFFQNTIQRFRDNNRGFFRALFFMTLERVSERERGRSVVY